MIVTPVFKRFYHVEIREPEGVYLLSEDGPYLLKGPLFCRIVPLIDGRRSVEEIAEALAGQDNMLQVRLALVFLEQRGYVVEATDDVPAARAAFWELLGADAGQAERRLRETTAAVRCFGDVP